MDENSDKYVMHFGVRIDKTRPSAQLNREKYLQVSENVSISSYPWAKRDVDQGIADYYIFDEENKKVFYAESHKQLLKENALQNFDINMENFEVLDKQEFEEALDSYIKKHHFTEITDLKCDKFVDPYEQGIDGYIYIMVLGKYKQVYIGMTRQSLCVRIKRHWSNKKPLDRLVFGSVNTSQISIDSFGPLDTTQIFAKPYRGKKINGLERLESRYIHAFDYRFLLNRLS